MLLEQEINVNKILDWLQAEFDARGIAARIASERVRERRETAYSGERDIVYQYVLVPVFLDTEWETYPSPLVSIENAWNDREPPPGKRLFLYPGQVPDGVV